MTTGKSAVMLAMVVALAVTGWICVYKADVLVRMQRKQYEKYAFVRCNPFARMVNKSWYPRYMVASGVFIWLWDIVLVYLAWFHTPVR